MVMYNVTVAGGSYQNNSWTKGHPPTHTHIHPVFIPLATSCFDMYWNLKVYLLNDCTICAIRMKPTSFGAGAKMTTIYIEF